MAPISLSKKQREDLLKTLKARFEQNMNRHKDVQWPQLQARLEANPEKLWTLNEMERTGGEPDVVSHDKNGEFMFMIVPRNLRMAAEVFATTAPRWTPEKKISQRVALWTWQGPCPLSSYPKNNIESCRDLESSIRRRPAG